jgi:hypothetical protein
MLALIGDLHFYDLVRRPPQSLQDCPIDQEPGDRHLSYDGKIRECVDALHLFSDEIRDRPEGQGLS